MCGGVPSTIKRSLFYKHVDLVGLNIVVLFYKHVVGLNIVVHAVPAYGASSSTVLVYLSTYLVPSRLIHLHFPQISPILNRGIYVHHCSESEFLLVVGMHFVSSLIELLV